MKEQLERLRLDGFDTIFLAYAGACSRADPAERIMTDLKDSDQRHLLNFDTAANQRRFALGQPGLRWLVYRSSLAVTCTPLQVRASTGLQAAERALISALRPLCLNSAPGGYYHLGLPRDACSSAALPIAPRYRPSAPAQLCHQQLNQLVQRHFANQLSWCISVPNIGPFLTDAALSQVVNLACQSRW